MEDLNVGVTIINPFDPNCQIEFHPCRCDTCMHKDSIGKDHLCAKDAGPVEQPVAKHYNTSQLNNCHILSDTLLHPRVRVQVLEV